MKRIARRNLAMNQRIKSLISCAAACAVTALILAACGSSGPDTQAPLTPENFRRSGGGDGTNILTWTANRERDLAGYRLYRAEGDPSAGYRVIADSIHPDTTQYLDTGLEYTVQYYYKLSAYDRSLNESAPTDPVMGIPANLSAPDAPQNVRVVAQSVSTPSITVSWSPNTEGDLDEYRVFRSTDTPVNTLVSTPIATPSKEQTIHIDTDVNVGTRYYYRVVAVDRGALVSQPSAEASDIPLVPPTLTMPANGSAARSKTPTFEWLLVSQAVGYRIVVGSDETFTVQLWNHHVGAQTSTVTYGGDALTSGHQYFWYVVTTTADPTRANSKSAVWSFVAP